LVENSYCYVIMRRHNRDAVIRARWKCVTHIGHKEVSKNFQIVMKNKEARVNLVKHVLPVLAN